MVSLIVCHQCSVNIARIADVFEERVRLQVGGDRAPVAVEALVVVVEDVEDTLSSLVQAVLQGEPPGVLEILSLIDDNGIEGEIWLRTSGSGEGIGILRIEHMLLVNSLRLS